MHNLRKTTGVTLIEVNLAMGVLLFGILSVAALFPVGLTLAEQSFKATDSAIIAVMAKTQLQILKRSSNFRYPAYVYVGVLEGRLVEGVPLRKKVDFFKFLGCKPLDSKPGSKLKWKPNAWKDRYMMMTSGREAGKIYEIASNAQNTLVLKDNIARERLRKDDSFRIIYNQGGTQCIPTGFLTRGERIPTINGLAIDKLERELERKVTQDDLPDNSAAALDRKGYCRYSYAILLAGPESPDLFRAYVLIYKDFDATITPARDWWKNRAPIKYYAFGYRRR